MRVRGVWSGPNEAGFSRESIGAYLDDLASFGFNEIFMNVKQGDGSLCWPSSVAPAAVRPEYRNFDFPAVLIEEATRRGMRIHAWMIDYMEGENGVAFTQHPEWAVLDRKGNATNHEVLRGKRFDAVWMCPARRPGYTDQWLVPLYKELAERYEFASIHHDYVRYPGDLAPDQYCFCDYCLTQLPLWAGYVNDAHPAAPFFHELYDREYLEAHWEQSPRVLPANWDRLPRSFKSDFLLEGSFFNGGRSDLDYFFYRYRVAAIDRFVRESAEAVRSGNPNTKLSGAYFKNPIHSGRFIGQEWSAFAPWSDIAIPMDYRDHFPGTMDHYLDLLAEAIERQKAWCADRQELYIGFAIWPLYREHPEGPFEQGLVRRTIERIAESRVDGLVVFCSWDIEKYGVADEVRASLKVLR